MSHVMLSTWGQFNSSYFERPFSAKIVKDVFYKVTARNLQVYYWIRGGGRGIGSIATVGIHNFFLT